MPLELTDTQATLTGHVDIADAEPLLDWLRVSPDPKVDITGCSSAHTAVVQILLATAPRFEGLDEATDWRALLRPPHSHTFEKSET